jgi:putative DNA primase/helicase
MASDKLTPMEKAYMIAKMFFEEKDIICFNKDFYLFNDGIWRSESKENTNSWITTQYIRTFSEPPRANHVNEITNLIQSLTYDKYRKKIKYLESGEHQNTINTKSGILNLNTLELKQYTKEDFCFNKLPFDYIENPSCPIMCKFLTSSMDMDNYCTDDKSNENYKLTMQFIQEWMGYSLLPSNNLHKGLIMFGDGRNGKGVLQHIWSKILGDHNVSYVDIKYINDGSEVFMTKNKLVNFSADLEANQQLDTGVIKQATSEERITVNEKYKPQYTMRFTAKIIIACNDLPFVKNTGAAIRERFYILPFERVFSEEERDPYLKTKLEGEAEHIFSWAVNGLQRIMKRGYFVPPEKCTIAGGNYMRDNDVIQLWIEEDNIIKKGGRAKRSDTWEHFKLYALDAGERSIRKPSFFKKMLLKGFKTIKTNGIYYYEDVELPNQSVLL